MSIFPKTNKNKTEATSNVFQLAHLTWDELVLSEKVKQGSPILSIGATKLLSCNNRNNASALLEALSLRLPNSKLGCSFQFSNGQGSCSLEQFNSRHHKNQTRFQVNFVKFNPPATFPSIWQGSVCLAIANLV